MRTTLGTALVILGLAGGSALAQTQPPRGNMAFCLETTSGDKNCGFTTMAQCNAAKTGQSDSCAPNPQATTGAGSGMAPGTNGSQRGLAPGTGMAPSR